MKKQRIAVIHQQAYGLERIGGAEMVCLWTLEALKDIYDVTLMVPYIGTFTEQFDLLNAQYGTTFAKGDFKVTSFPKSTFLQKCMTRIWAFRTYYFMWKVRQDAKNYDLMFSTFNEMDFGKPGLQYIHYPMIASIQKGGIGNFVKYIYRSSMPALFGYSKERMLKNTSITCSEWTRADIRTIYGIDAKIAYPPVLPVPVSNTTAKRKDGFVFVGRISPEKRIEDIIAIGDIIRARGYPFELHIIGPAYRKEYADYIFGLAKERADWVHIEGLADRKRLGEFLSTYTYGINCTKDEQFGISLVEMIYAGCLPFVYNGGGQLEVIDKNKDLYFSSLEEAAEKILHVQKDEALKTKLLKQLHSHAQKFSTSAYMHNIQHLVRHHLTEL